MLISFPTIPTPYIPNIPTPSESYETSGSHSTVTTCVNGKCSIYEENSATGSSYLKVTTISDGEETKTTVEGSASESGKSQKKENNDENRVDNSFQGRVMSEIEKNVNKKVLDSVKEIFEKLVSFFSKILDKKIN